VAVSELERFEPVDLGFSVADASAPELNLRRPRLTLRFKEGVQPVCLTCEDVVALRRQEADTFADVGTYVIGNSTWLAGHIDQGHATQDELRGRRSPGVHPQRSLSTTAARSRAQTAAMAASSASLLLLSR